MLNKIVFGSSLLSLSVSAFAGPFVTTTLGFKAYEVFSLKAENGSEIKIGEGKISPRPVLIDANDWKSIGKALGVQGNLKFCDRDKLSIEDFLKSIEIKTDASSIARRLENEYGTGIKPEEQGKIKSIPSCLAFSEVIIDLGKALNLTTSGVSLVDIHSNQDNFTDPTMISQIGFADEGHGWLTARNRLTTGQNAVFHLAVKTKDFVGLLAKAQHDVTLQYTKQPVALRFVQKKYTRKVIEGYEHTESCTGTVYKDRCTYDPETKTGKCEKVPYTVEGTRTYRIDDVIDTYFTQIQFMSADFSRVLGAADVKDEATYEDRDWGNCDLPNVPDHDHNR
jgi:hypothetical protein